MTTCGNLFVQKMTIFLLSCSCFKQIHASSNYSTEVNCTCLERQLETALKDDFPPRRPNWKTCSTGRYFSNAHNISRALYPPKKAPAKFIGIKVRFYNASFNTTRNENYVWALSCVYAVLPRNLLAMVSLGTLYHERNVLKLSVPEFCDGVPREKYMEYALSSVRLLYLNLNKNVGFKIIDQSLSENLER